MSSPTIVIRTAVREDCPRMLELVHELAVYEKAPDDVTVTLPHFEESGFGEKPVWWALVACAGQEVVGFALYYIRYSTWKGQRMYLEDLLITEQWRGKGIGAMLMDALKAEAIKKQLQGISWQVLNWNEPAIHFYKKYETRFDDEWINCRIDL
jgi:ribosomal protein S18 acetylase RimI-like enzyme